MARFTLDVDGTGLELLMTVAALRVEGIGAFHDLRILDFIWLMAITAYFERLRLVFIFSVALSAGNQSRIVIKRHMMAIPAGKSVC